MLTLNQGNLYKLEYNFTNADSSPKDLTGTTELQYSLALRKNTAPIISMVLADPELEITDPVNGLVTITLTPENTKLLGEGTYYHELRHTNAVGEPVTLLTEALHVSGRLIKE
jgi:hypothetical protein